MLQCHQLLLSFRQLRGQAGPLLLMCRGLLLRLLLQAAALILQPASGCIPCVQSSDTVRKRKVQTAPCGSWLDMSRLPLLTSRHNCMAVMFPAAAALSAACHVTTQLAPVSIHPAVLQVCLALL
jgi:hypothetical protein